MFPMRSSNCSVLSGVPSEICAGRLCRGRERRSPSKSETEPRTAPNGKPLVKHGDLSKSRCYTSLSRIRYCGAWYTSCVMRRRYSPMMPSENIMAPEKNRTSKTRVIQPGTVIRPMKKRVK
jgi:hypothetical protein